MIDANEELNSIKATKPGAIASGFAVYSDNCVVFFTQSGFNKICDRGLDLGIIQLT